MNREANLPDYIVCIYDGAKSIPVGRAEFVKTDWPELIADSVEVYLDRSVNLPAGDGFVIRPRRYAEIECDADAFPEYFG